MPQQQSDTVSTAAAGAAGAAEGAADVCRPVLEVKERQLLGMCGRRGFDRGTDRETDRQTDRAGVRAAGRSVGRSVGRHPVWTGSRAGPVSAPRAV